MKHLFVSDCHLSPDRPEVIGSFINFLASIDAAEVKQLYILGDFFDVWIGDDDSECAMPDVIGALRELSARVPVFYMRGNRDFLVDSVFARRSGCQFLPDVCVRTFDGEAVLLMHGDLLCTGDRAYQAYRKVIRHPQTRRLIMALKPSLRKRIATGLRGYSGAANKRKTAAKMDVEQPAVNDYMNRFSVTRLIHGHTHQHAIYDFTLNGAPAQRIVLGSWHCNGSILELINGQAALCTLEIGGTPG